MAYNSNTDWENEKKYLDSLSQSGDAGQKAWAESQKKTLADAEAKYKSTSGSTSGGSERGLAGGKSDSSAVTSSSNSGSKTNKNSQYTAVDLGDTWDANIDYQAIINDAVASGDYVTAAKAEQLRNQKIIATGSNYNTSNKYLNYYPDLGTLGTQKMDSGASWQDVLDIYNARNYKASTTEGLDKYMNDSTQQMMWQYITDSIKESNQPDEFSYEEPKPEAPKTDKRIDKLLNEILNRDDFSYDAMSDPLYQQYAAMYQREGDRAMKETLAEAAAGAGGMNTYAITAAQQANSYYNSQLNDKIPQLYQLAYDMYLNDIEGKVQDLGILQNMDATQYNRYRDTINDWYNDKNFAYGVYQDAVQQGNWNTNFDYNSILDNRDWNNTQYWANKEWNYNDYWKNKEWNYNDEWRNKEWNYNDEWKNKEFENENYWKDKEFTANQEDKQYDRDVYDKESANAKVEYLISLGITPSADLIAQSDWSQADVNNAVAEVKKNSIISTGGTKKTTGTKTPGKKTTDDKTPKVTDIKQSDVINLGLGPISNKTLEELATDGSVIIKNDGSVKWNDSKKIFPF